MSNLLPPPDPNAKVLEMAPPTPEMTSQAVRAGEAVVGGLVEAKQTREPLLPKERLRDMVMHSGVGVHAFIDATEIHSSLKMDLRMATFGFNTIATHDFMKSNTSPENSPRLPDALIDKLLSSGVTETFTTHYLDTTVRDLLGDPRMSNEQAVFMRYRTIGGMKPKHLYEMSEKAQENYNAYSNIGKINTSDAMFDITIAMPKTLAEEFIHAAQRDPQLIRELTESAVIDGLKGENIWNGPRGVRPAYEWLHEYNHGKDKIAVQLGRKDGQRPEIEYLEFSAVNSEG